MILSSLSKRCGICQAKHNTLYYHRNKQGVAWLFCNKCGTGMDLDIYCDMLGIEIPSEEMLAKICHDDPSDQELIKMNWPKNFIPLWNKDAKEGIKYLESRKIKPTDGIFYDEDTNGIVFPYYYDSYCVGAQIRFIEPKVKDEVKFKISTVPGTKLGKLFYGWNQLSLNPNIKYIIVTEGAFNSLALQQTLNSKYKSILSNPYKTIAVSGSSIGNHRAELLREKISEGYKVILSADLDAAGMKMMSKCCEEACITHYTFPENSGDKWNDWNDVLIQGGEDKVLELFTKNLKKA